MNYPPTKSMKKILMDAYNGNCVSSANKTQLKGLVSRNYLNNEFNITEEGKLYIISTLPLVSQCKKLGLPIQILEWDKSKKPEIWALEYFSNLGFIGAYCEGGAIGLVLTQLHHLTTPKPPIHFTKYFKTHLPAPHLLIYV